MKTRTMAIGWLLLTQACGPGGPGDSAGSEGGSTTEGATMGGTTTSGGTSGTSAASSSEGSATTDTPTTGATSGATTTGATTTGATVTGTTTDAPACAAIVGSTDCAALAEVSPDLSLEECMMCQGAPCGEHEQCDSQYPCVDGFIVLRGCCTDGQCEGLTPFCGMFIATNNVCVKNDDI